MTAMLAIGTSPVPANHVLGRKLDSIPFSAYHLMLIGVLGLVGFVDGYDLAVTGSLLVLAKKPLHLVVVSIGAFIPLLFGRETVGQLETFTEAVLEPA
jgi:hypothetical protein